jgi:hypothetical protein
MPKINHYEEQSTKIMKDNVGIATETTTMKNVIDDRTKFGKWKMYTEQQTRSNINKGSKGQG